MNNAPANRNALHIINKLEAAGVDVYWARSIGQSAFSQFAFEINGGTAKCVQRTYTTWTLSWGDKSTSISTHEIVHCALRLQ